MTDFNKMLPLALWYRSSVRRLLRNHNPALLFCYCVPSSPFLCVIQDPIVVTMAPKHTLSSKRPTRVPKTTESASFTKYKHFPFFELPQEIQDMIITLYYGSYSLIIRPRGARRPDNEPAPSSMPARPRTCQQARQQYRYAYPQGCFLWSVLCLLVKDLRVRPTFVADAMRRRGVASDADNSP